MKSLFLISLAAVVLTTVTARSQEAASSKFLKVPTAKRPAYYVFSEPKGFAEAANICARRYMVSGKPLYHLMTPNGGKDHAAMTKLMIKNPKQKFWVGVNALKDPSSWNWTNDAGHPVSGQDNWEKGEPNNFQNNNERCVEARVHHDGKVKWNDAPCDHQNLFICKRSGEQQYALKVQRA